MTYQLYYIPNGDSEYSRGYTLFDIEYYKTQSEEKDKWFSEIHCLPIVEGITHFLNDKFKDDTFDYKEFIKDAEEIQEIRGLLYEKFDNKPKIHKDCDEFHYRIFGKTLKTILMDFCDKYGLWINVD